MKSRFVLVLVLFVFVSLSGVSLESVVPGASARRVVVSKAEMQVFTPAGPFGGGVLVPGTIFPPTKGGTTILKRGRDCLQYTTHTTGLPAGAYTNWWVLWNNPENCLDPSNCGFDDFFVDGAATFWATGGVVQANGVGNFQDRHCVGDDLGFPGSQNLIGNGLTNPMGAVFWSIIKYHGPASDDRDVLFHQTHTVLGSCFEGANAFDFGPPFGVQCFDPQLAILVP